jgi:hypothetical protein
MKMTDDTTRTMQGLRDYLSHFYTPEQIAEFENPSEKPPRTFAYIPPPPIEEFEKYAADLAAQKATKAYQNRLAVSEARRMKTEKDLDDAERKIRELNNVLDDNSH